MYPAVTFLAGARPAVNWSCFQGMLALNLNGNPDRSLSQICEMLLKIGVDEYDKEGHKYLHKTMISTREEGQRQAFCKFEERAASRC